MKDINISVGIFIWPPGSSPRGRTWGYHGGLGFNLFPKFNHIWSVRYLHEWHMHRHHFVLSHPLGPWGGAKRSNIIKSELPRQFHRFLNFVYLPTHERYTIYQTGFSFDPLGGTWGYRGGWESKNVFFFFRNSTRFGV